MIEVSLQKNFFTGKCVECGPLVQAGEAGAGERVERPLVHAGEALA